MTTRAHRMLSTLALLLQLVLVASGVCTHKQDDHNDHNTLKKMEEEGIVPDVIDKLPAHELSVQFGGKIVAYGNELTPTEVKDVPDVKWDADDDAYYTLAMVDPDAPSRADPKFREVKHWLVGNIPGARLADGDVIAAFMSSGPPKGTGKHRYVFLLFKQPRKLAFDGEPKSGAWSRANRLNFNLRQFVHAHNLGDPIAGNFYQAQWDSYVEERNKKIVS